MADAMYVETKRSDLNTLKYGSCTAGFSPVQITSEITVTHVKSPILPNHIEPIKWLVTQIPLLGEKDCEIMDHEARLIEQVVPVTVPVLEEPNISKSDFLINSARLAMHLNVDTVKSKLLDEKLKIEISANSLHWGTQAGKNVPKSLQVIWGY